MSALTLAAATPAMAVTPSLRGSPASMVRQNEVARANDYSFLRDGAAVRRMVEKGHLVRIRGGGDLSLAGVSFPFARPAVGTFLDRLATQYREACGERLVVTSLTRPSALQPRNAHRLSVHPAGMAVDLRISGRAKCRAWLEGTLLSLERKGLLDATREKRPPHYHVAVFPDAYAAHVARQGGAEAGPEPAPVAASLDADDAPTPLEAVLDAAPAEDLPVPEVAEESPDHRAASVAATVSVLLVLGGLAFGRLDRRRRGMAPA